MSSDTTVYIVDDDPTVRRSVARLVGVAGYAVIAFGSPQEFLQCELPTKPTCILLDMRMDGMTGLEVQEILYTRQRQAPIIFLSAFGTISMAAEGFKRGAIDFFEKPVRPEALLDAIARAIELDRQQCDQWAGQQQITACFNSLTARECDVMGLVVRGLLNKQAAAELGISEKTVKVHRARIMAKMKVESLAALVIVAEHLGLPVAMQRGAQPDEGHTTGFSRTFHIDGDHGGRHDSTHLRNTDAHLASAMLRRPRAVHPIA